ncbi:hypothetical protein, partial [Limosilactobacillus fermentum]|uniref:hypothetical protein n=1 Tax=Limosilactobacillus fermentum TaxID=1613 RepID=UPI001EDE9CE3
MLAIPQIRFVPPVPFGRRLSQAAKSVLINISRKSRDFSHGMDRPLLSPFMGLFVCFCIFLVIDIFL